jgi:hypothetical protein
MRKAVPDSFFLFVRCEMSPGVSVAPRTLQTVEKAQRENFRHSLRHRMSSALKLLHTRKLVDPLFLGNWTAWCQAQIWANSWFTNACPSNAYQQHETNSGRCTEFFTETGTSPMNKAYSVLLLDLGSCCFCLSNLAGHCIFVDSSLGSLKRRKCSCTRRRLSCSWLDDDTGQPQHLGVERSFVWEVFSLVPQCFRGTRKKNKRRKSEKKSLSPCFHARNMKRKVQRKLLMNTRFSLFRYLERKYASCRISTSAKIWAKSVEEGSKWQHAANYFMTGFEGDAGEPFAVTKVQKSVCCGAISQELPRGLGHCNRRRNATNINRVAAHWLPTCNKRPHATTHTNPLATIISHIILQYSCLFRWWYPGGIIPSY